MLPRCLSHLNDPTDLHGSFQTMFLVTFLCGLTSIRIRGPISNRTVELSRWAFAVTLLHGVLFGFSFLWAFLHNESIVGHFFQSDLAKVGDSLQKFSGMLGMVLLFWKFIANRQLLLKFVFKLVYIDERLFQIGVLYKYHITARFVNLELVAMFALNVAFAALSIFVLLWRNGVHPSLAACASFFSPQLFISVVTVMFSCFVVRVQERFGICVKVLKNQLRQWDGKKPKPPKKPNKSVTIFTIVTKDRSAVIHDVMEIHQLVVEAAATANQYFSYQLLTIISISFLIIVFDAYYVLETFLGRSKRDVQLKTAEFVTFFMAQMVLYVIAVVSIVEGSSGVVKESERTAVMVHKLMRNADNSEVLRKLEQFSMQLSHLKVQFTAAGLFAIDRTLYFTISGAVTTYLIILLQFTSLSPTHHQQ